MILILTAYNLASRNLEGGAISKLKLSLIDVYLLFVRLDYWFKYWATNGTEKWLLDICKKAETLCAKHLKMCKQMIFRLGLMDASFWLMCSQVENKDFFINSNGSSKPTKKTLIKNLNCLKQSIELLPPLAKKLKFSSAEQKYLFS